MFCLENIKIKIYLYFRACVDPQFQMSSPDWATSFLCFFGGKLVDGLPPAYNLNVISDSPRQKMSFNYVVHWTSQK